MGAIAGVAVTFYRMFVEWGYCCSYLEALGVLGQWCCACSNISTCLSFKLLSSAVCALAFLKRSLVC